jgi:hypothetical protein
MTKEELLQQIQTDRRQLERYLFYFEKDDLGDFVPSKRLKLSAKKMLQPGAANKLSVKGILTLISGWEGYFIEWYNHHMYGNELTKFPPELSWEDKNQIDEIILANNKDQTLEDTLQEFRSSYQQILKTIEKIPEDDLLSASRFAWTGSQSLVEYVGRVTWEQYRWAKVHIRKWSRTGGRKGMDKEDILDRIQTERRRLDNNLADLTEQKMIESGVIGEWSIKDILAHLVDWEQRFLGWYQAGLRGEIPHTPATGMTWGDLDQLNQLIFEEHKDQPIEHVKAEFQTSYQQVLNTVKAIPEEDIFPVGRFAWTRKSNLAAYILANTANHYRWAKTQIRKWKRNCE